MPGYDRQRRKSMICIIRIVLNKIIQIIAEL